MLFDPGSQVNLITEDLVNDLELHTQPYAGHRRKAGTLSVLERHFYWPTLQRDLYKFVE